jgi:hypothetical protein
MQIIVLRGADEAAHAAMVAALEADNPNLRWASSYRTSGGSISYVDVLEVTPEEGSAVGQVLGGLADLEFELLEAEPSEMFEAPGG